MKWIWTGVMAIGLIFGVNFAVQASWLSEALHNGNVVTNRGLSSVSPIYGNNQPQPRAGIVQGIVRAVGGLNLNIIENSGNGAGNQIFTRGSSPGGININIIKGSANGVNNRIGIGP